MKYTAVSADQYRDLVIGLVVFLLTIMIWAIALAPAAV